MNNIEYFPQIQDESTEHDFVDSDHPQDIYPTNFVDPSTVPSYQNMGQWYPLEPLTNEDSFLSHFTDQADVYDLGMDSMPQALDDLSGDDFSLPIAGMDLHLDHFDAALFDNAAFSNPLPELSETQNETNSGEVSLSGSLDLNFTL
ncbi:hypothetical protein F53441_14235 [Fusarium austroafricanum]|uniref:Uncharacterized protein n=1 Tax=Fusarium austroafricanum TaxID=2364996 RepID=A0A8H4JG62_9HYPO|nr:hypothetical protein F53441_14235 [Fusarium austroafricanum]